MPYTPSLFTLELSRWVEVYEWRNLTKMELCAYGTYLESMGVMIPYTQLTSHKSRWKNGLYRLEEICKWNLEYEEQYMVFAASNRKLADSQLDLLFFILFRSSLSRAKGFINLIRGQTPESDDIGQH